MVFPRGECAIYRAESVSWNRRTGTLTLNRPGRTASEHWRSDLQVVAWGWVDESIRDRTWKLKTGYPARH